MIIAGIAGDMSWLQAVVLGMLQGITEFLPVSSTAHMALASRLMYGTDAGAAFSAVVQLGPIVAIIWYFRGDLIRYVRGIMRTGSPGKAISTDDSDAKLGWFTLFGTVPLAVAGLLLEKKVDTTFRTPSIMGILLIVLAVIMLAAEKYGKRNHDLTQMSFGESQKIGLAQALALVPGASRSGVTITAGMFLGLDRESAARFSFLLSIPAITAAGLYKLLKVVKHTGLGGEAGIYVLAAVVAGAVAYAVTKWFLGYMKHHNTNLFIVYRIALGIVLLALVATHKISNAPPAPEPERASAPAEVMRARTPTSHPEQGLLSASLRSRSQMAKPSAPNANISPDPSLGSVREGADRRSIGRLPVTLSPHLPALKNHALA